MLVQLTLRKYLLKVPSGKVTETLAILVYEDVLQDSAETSLVTGGKTRTSLQLGWGWGGETFESTLNSILTTALLRGKFPSISSSHSDDNILGC